MFTTIKSSGFLQFNTKYPTATANKQLTYEQLWNMAGYIHPRNDFITNCVAVDIQAEEGVTYSAEEVSSFWHFNLYILDDIKS